MHEQIPVSFVYMELNLIRQFFFRTTNNPVDNLLYSLVFQSCRRNWLALTTTVFFKAWISSALKSRVSAWNVSRSTGKGYRNHKHFQVLTQHPWLARTISASHWNLTTQRCIRYARFHCFTVLISLFFDRYVHFRVPLPLRVFCGKCFRRAS